LGPKTYFTNGIYTRSSQPAERGTIEVSVDGAGLDSKSRQIAVLAYRPVMADGLSAVVVMRTPGESAQATLDALAAQPWASDNAVQLPLREVPGKEADADLRRHEEMWLSAVAFAQAAALEGALSRNLKRENAREELDSLQGLYAEVREAMRTLWWPFASYDLSLQGFYVVPQRLMGSQMLHEEALGEIALLEAGARARVLDSERARQVLEVNVQTQKQELEQGRAKRIAGIASVFTVVGGLLGLSAIWFWLPWCLTRP
jgi:hypothetical protein